jgi:hypothetical protein
MPTCNVMEHAFVPPVRSRCCPVRRRTAESAARVEDDFINKICQTVKHSRRSANEGYNLLEDVTDCSIAVNEFSPSAHCTFT